MGVLRDAGVVTARRRGRWVDYALVDGVLDQVGSAVAAGVLV
jgi:DNA-binding transcriptional ArsR family regulator